MGALHVIVDIIVVLVTLAAWVSGSLDPLQKRLQEIALDTMGETKVSYGLKKSLTSKRLVEDKNLSQIQDQLGSSVGGVFGKGGIGHDLGAGLSKGL